MSCLRVSPIRVPATRGVTSFSDRKMASYAAHTLRRGIITHVVQTMVQGKDVVDSICSCTSKGFLSGSFAAETNLAQQEVVQDDLDKMLEVCMARFYNVCDAARSARPCHPAWR